MRSETGRPLFAAVLVIAALFGFALIFVRAMERGLNHDEHQFIAPAWLWAEKGLVPYQDFPLFHLPNLVYVYGGLFGFTDYKLLAARCLSACAAWATVALVCALGVRWAKSNGANPIPCLVLGAVLFLTDPLFLQAAGKTWNHDIPAFLVVAAFAAACIGATRNRNAVLWFALAGLCTGLAAGTRLTFAPLTVPFAIAVFFVPGLNFPRRLRVFLGFSAGFALAMSPSIHSYFTSPESFLFGNLQYPRLGLLDPANERIQKTVTLWRKLRYFFKEIVVTSWPLFVAFAAVGMPKIAADLRTGKTRAFESVLLTGLLPFALLGCFAPSRYQFQHFYCLVPILMLAIVRGLAFHPKPWPAGIVAVAAAASLAIHGREYADLRQIGNPQSWATVNAHLFGEELREKLADGKLLTLAPIYAVEGGLDIYPAFATGPFGWRSAHLRSPERRAKFHLIAPDDLETALQADPPAGILVGFEKEKLEAPLIAYAKKHGYTAEKVSRKKITLWVRP